MTLKPYLLRHQPSRLVLISALIVGVGLAATLFFVGILVDRMTISIVDHMGWWHSESLYQRGQSTQRVLQPGPIGERGFDTRLHVVWAGLSAAFGQMAALFVWLPPLARAPFGLTRKSIAQRLRATHAESAVWAGLILMLWTKVWFIHATLVQYWSGQTEQTVSIEPEIAFVGSLLTAFLLVQPWIGIRRAYRCRWWPPVGIGGALAAALALTMAVR